MSPLTRRLAALAAAAILLPVVAVTSVAAAGNAITVTTLADTVANDGTCSLREALTAANSNAASGAAAGECPAGSASGSDTITFAVAGTITETSYLPEITSDLTIDGGGRITISGATLYRPITVLSGTVGVKNLTVTAGHDDVAYGGGIYNAGTMTVTNVTVTGNQSTFGGGILNNSGSLAIIDSTISANTAQFGGGLTSWGLATLTINGSVISGNTTSFYAAGVFASAGTVTIADSTISDNSAGDLGGGLLVSSVGTATIIRSTISGNSASNGGAVRNEGTLSIANSTLAGNTASSFSGAVSNIGILTVTNATITGNSAISAVGGLNDEGTSTVVNSIVAGNTPDDVSAGIDTVTASLIAVSTTGLLDPAGLADNGGPTRTIRLLGTAGSAIDHGDPTACGSGDVDGLDQRNVTRSATCDIGAYEIEATPPTVTAPAATLRSGTQLSGSALPVHLAWTGADNAKVDHYVLEKSTNGGPWTTVSSSIPSAAYDLYLAKSSAYRFRVTAVDKDGNPSSVVAGPTLGAVLTQQTSSKVHYNTTWTSSSKVAFSGGSARYKKTKGASASYTFTGRSIAFVTTKGPSRGKAKIYINGSYVTTIDLYASSTTYRVLAYQKTWSSSGTRKIKIVVSGTSGRPRVDLDAFAVLK